jgi:hypothetical protein
LPLAKSGLTTRLEYMKAFENLYPRWWWDQYALQDVTDIFLEDLLVALDTWQNRFIFILGDPGSAKSLAAMIVGKILNTLAEGISGKEIDFSVRHNIRSDMMKVIGSIEKAKDFETYIHDESLKLMGQGSMTAINELKNLMKAAARHRQINLILVGNEFLTMRLYNYVLLTRDRYINDLDHRKTDWVQLEVWCKTWTDLTGNYFPVGRITLPVALVGEEFIKEYEKQEKVPKVEKTQNEGGFPESDELRREFLARHGKAIPRELAQKPEPKPVPSTFLDEAPCPECHKKTVRGYADYDAKLWRFVCSTCNKSTRDPMPLEA